MTVHRILPGQRVGLVGRVIRFAGSVVVLLVACALPSWAAGDGTSSGLTLLRLTGPRPSALGDAFTAAPDDINGFDFNPAVLGTLKGGHLSLQHEAGMMDDAFSKAAVGWRQQGVGIGAVAGHYDAGRAVLFDGVNPPRHIKAQEDWVAAVGFGLSRRGLAVGLSGRQVWSRLADTYSGSAVTVDAGAQVGLGQRVRFGVSGPVAQSRMRYAGVSEALPRIYRVGMMWDIALALATGDYPVTLFLDTPYDRNARKMQVAAGAETRAGPLTVRVGSSSGAGVKHVTCGAGFHLRHVTLDYAFGLVQKGLDHTHRVGMSLRFGSGFDSLLAAAEPKRREVIYLDAAEHPQSYGMAPAAPSPGGDALADAFNGDPEARRRYLEMVKMRKQAAGRSYTVRSGDTLASIAAAMYGDERWKALIYYENREKISDPDALPAGLSLTLP